MKIRMFESKSAAIAFVREKTGKSNAAATRHVNEYLFRAEDSGYRVWINIDGID